MKRWTVDEWQNAKRMLDGGADRDVVARAIGRALGCLKEKIRWEGLSPEQRAARLEYLREKRRAASKLSDIPNREVCAPKRAVSTGPFISDEVLADRDARKNLAPRDLSAAFFGDPLPGYSALERRP
jgi:hypothetical protein